jgi:hypothetical protein
MHIVDTGRIETDNKICVGILKINKIISLIISHVCGIKYLLQIMHIFMEVLA